MSYSQRLQQRVTDFNEENNRRVVIDVGKNADLHFFPPVGENEPMIVEKDSTYKDTKTGRGKKYLEMTYNVINMSSQSEEIKTFTISNQAANLAIGNAIDPDGNHRQYDLVIKHIAKGVWDVQPSDKKYEGEQ
jgi:DNA topoisomerase VI subunit B